KEVLTGKAKFGIFGDGKEVAQVAMAKFFQPGDFRSGYYRDQTFMFATGLATLKQFFAQLYADPDPEREPFSSGRQMNCHFATPFVNQDGDWLDLANRKNVSSDIAPTGGQMPRALGLAFASKAFRNVESLKSLQNLSKNGNEVCFCTIGDASTSEGHFWETINAAGVMQVPLAVFVWDDGYGISVPKKYQTTKSSISDALAGMQKKEGTNGINIYKVKGRGYAGMCEAFEEGLRIARETHTPVLLHVEEITQPQGHSTSGSHARYKSPDRLEWEREWECLQKMKEWMMANGLAEEDELNKIEEDAREEVKSERAAAWDEFLTPIRNQVSRATSLMTELAGYVPEHADAVTKISNALSSTREPLRRDVMKALGETLMLAGESGAASEVREYYNQLKEENRKLYSAYLYNEGPKSALKVQEVKAEIPDDAPVMNGYEILNRFFDFTFSRDPKVIAFGEDLGHIGDVNQGFSGLQEKHGAGRIFDT